MGGFGEEVVQSGFESFGAPVGQGLEFFNCSLEQIDHFLFGELFDEFVSQKLVDVEFWVFEEVIGHIF